MPDKIDGYPNNDEGRVKKEIENETGIYRNFGCRIEKSQPLYCSAIGKVKKQYHT
jgi:hypothetical protein